jgi:hypothetical protein
MLLLYFQHSYHILTIFFFSRGTVAAGNRGLYYHADTVCFNFHIIIISSQCLYFQHHSYQISTKYFFLVAQWLQVTAVA